MLQGWLTVRQMMPGGGRQARLSRHGMSSCPGVARTCLMQLHASQSASNCLCSCSVWAAAAVRFTYRLRGCVVTHAARLTLTVCVSIHAGAVLPVLVDAGCTFESAADMLGQQLADKCGCMRYGTSALGHPKRSLLKEASGGAKRQLTLLKCIGMPLIVVPFFELLGTQAAAAAAPTTSSGRVCGTTTDGPDDGGDKDRALQYVQAVLREHCHLAGAFHC